MSSLSEKILVWYSENGRKLPWRDHPSPYAVWVSEIMLQQTRVETVIPYFYRWMKRFSTVQELAAASEQDVLSLWEGLGYYSRARSLYKAARIVMEKYQGNLPKDPAILSRLPGIGPYTSGAIASIAFNLDTPVLDGNLKRVFSRVYNVDKPSNLPEGEAELWRLARENLPKGHAGDFNQAMMDLGATICLPRNPICPLCPIMSACESNLKGIQDQRPVTKPKARIPHLIVTAAVLQRDGKVLLAKRPSRGLLGGMWEFPGGKKEDGESLEDCLVREIREELGVEIQVREPYGIYKHAYTHFRITLHAYSCIFSTGEPCPLEAEAIAWVSPDELGGYPMGKVDRCIARRFQGAAE